MKKFVRMYLILLFGLASAASGASVISTFDVNDEGWRVAGDAASGTPTYLAGGWIEADDTVSGGVWYFDAPGKFLGDQSGSFGQSLNFDLMQTGSGSQFNSSDVILNGGGIELTLDIASNPLPLGDWVAYSVLLSDAESWMNGGVAASEADIQSVLGSLTRLRLRGEFITGPDTGSLDNVILSSVPIPAAAWLFGSALLGLSAVKRRKA